MGAVCHITKFLYIQKSSISNIQGDCVSYNKDSRHPKIQYIQHPRWVCVLEQRFYTSKNPVYPTSKVGAFLRKKNLDIQKSSISNIQGVCVS